MNEARIGQKRTFRITAEPQVNFRRGISVYPKPCSLGERAIHCVLALGALLMAGSETARSATPPPPIPNERIIGMPSAGTKPTTGVQLGALQVVWETTLLAQVTRAIGAGAIQHEGDAGESAYWLCYTIAGERAQRIWLIADGEMGGPEQSVTRVAAEESTDGEASLDCPRLPKTFLPVTLGHGLWIGADEHSVSKAIHALPHVVGPLRSVQYHSKVPGKCEGGFDQLNWLEYKIDHGRVTAIWAGQVTSC